MSATFKPGDRVRVKRGDFLSHTGIVIVLDVRDIHEGVRIVEDGDPATAVPVRLSIYGREIPVWFPPDCLEQDETAPAH
jgi:transcription antitermination factor NusG